MVHLHTKTYFPKIRTISVFGSVLAYTKDEMLASPLERIGEMDNNILMFTLVILFQLMVTSLALAIFSSVFVKSRKKGLIFLIIYVLLSIYSLYDVYKDSVIMGSSMLFIYISLGVVTYFVIKKRLSNGTEI